MRECGECAECCYIGYVPELDKKEHTICPFMKKTTCGSCSIFDKPNLPATCKNYRCGWLNGYGDDQDRPNNSGVMISDNIIEDQRYFTAIETKKDALKQESGLRVALDVSRSTGVPILVVLFGQPLPNLGDQIIIHDKMLPNCKRIAGNLISKHDDVGIYVLLKGN